MEALYCVSVCTCRGQWSEPSVFVMSLVYLETASLLNLELIALPRLTSTHPRDPPASAPPALGLQVHTTTPRFFIRVLGGGPHACTASSLSSEPSPHFKDTLSLKCSPQGIIPSSCFFLTTTAIAHGLAREVLASAHLSRQILSDKRPSILLVSAFPH